MSFWSKGFEEWQVNSFMKLLPVEEAHFKYEKQHQENYRNAQVDGTHINNLD